MKGEYLPIWGTSSEFNVGLASWNMQLKKAWVKNKSILDSMGKNSDRAYGKLGRFATGLGKAQQKLQPLVKGFKNFAGFAGTLATGLLDIFGIFMQFAQATGILDPIMQLLTAVFQIIGAVAMETMIPAFEQFANVLFSPASMELWTQVGVVVGEFFAMILNYFTALLSTAEGRDLILRTVTGIVNLLTWLGGALGTFLQILTLVPPSVLGAIIFAFGVFFAFIQGIMYGGIAGVILGSIYAGIAAAVLWPLLTLAEGGLVTRPSMAMIGEGGEPEAVIPLSKFGELGLGGEASKDVLYATQDTNDKLDLILMELKRGKRLR